MLVRNKPYIKSLRPGKVTPSISKMAKYSEAMPAEYSLSMKKLRRRGRNAVEVVEGGKELVAHFWLTDGPFLADSTTLPCRHSSAVSI